MNWIVEKVVGSYPIEISRFIDSHLSCCFSGRSAAVQQNWRVTLEKRYLVSCWEEEEDRI